MGITGGWDRWGIEQFAERSGDAGRIQHDPCGTSTYWEGRSDWGCRTGSDPVETKPVADPNGDRIRHCDERGKNHTMKRLLFLIPLVLLAGCPAGTTQQQVAQAAQNASIAVQGFQQVEIAAHTAGTISDADHQFIQQELINVAAVGQTADSCIQTATTKAGTIQCVNTALQTVDQLNAAGALSIKSQDAKEKYQIAMTGVRTALAVIVTIEGGNTTTP